MPRSRSPSPVSLRIGPSTPPPTPPLSVDVDDLPLNLAIGYLSTASSPSKDRRQPEWEAAAIPVLDVPEEEATTKTDGLRTPSKSKVRANSFLSPSESTTLHESHLSPYGGSTYSSSLAGSPYVSPTAVRITARSPGKPRNDGMYSSPTSSPTKSKPPTSSIKSPEKVQTSPKKKAASQLGAPPPYSRYNTYTYSVKYQGQKQLGLGGPPFPSLFQNISTAPLFSSPGSSSLPTPLPTPTDSTFSDGEKADAFDSRPLSLSPFPSNTSTPKTFGVSHACYDPSPSRSSFGNSPFYFETKPKKPQPRPRITSAPDAQPHGQKGRSQLREAYELEACLSNSADWRPTSRWGAMLPSLRVSIDSLTEIPAQVREFSDTGAFWMALYFVFNLGLTLYNKGVLVRFPFPYTLTALHTFCGTVGTTWLWHTGYFTPARLTTRENITLSFFSILYTLNIAISNVSLQLVTVPFHQVVRASAPIPTILITLALLGNRGRGFLGVGKERFLTLIPVMLGVAFATYGDYYFTTWGLILTLLGTFLAALKTVITNMLQTTTKSASVPEISFPASPKTPHPPRGTGARAAPSKMKLHPLDLLLRMSPLAFLQCMIYAYVSGELHGVRNQFTGLGDINMSQRRLWALLVNGCIAFGLNIVSLTANRKCGPLSMTVAANVKQVLTICLAVVIFDLRITPTNGMGILLTLLGGMWFGAIEYQEKKAKSMLYVGIVHSGEKEKPTQVSADVEPSSALLDSDPAQPRKRNHQVRSPIMMTTEKFDPEKAENLPEIEKQWAVRAVEQAQVYWNLLSGIQPRSLRLTRLDDEIFEDFSKTFPHYVENIDSLAKLDEEQVKSSEGKEQWREFMARYEKKINDFNFGTLIRPDCKDEYTENNSMFVTRTQFYAIEIARNRLGLNDEIHLQAKAHAEKEKKAKAAAQSS